MTDLSDITDEQIIHVLTTGFISGAATSLRAAGLTAGESEAAARYKAGQVLADPIARLALINAARNEGELPAWIKPVDGGNR